MKATLLRQLLVALGEDLALGPAWAARAARATTAFDRPWLLGQLRRRLLVCTADGRARLRRWLDLQRVAPSTPTPPAQLLRWIRERVLCLGDLLVREADFVSIGTNDLIQYTLAVDRGNEETAPIYEPLHPAVLRALRAVVEAGRDHGKTVGICGEMAGEPLYAVVLLGLGLVEFSVSPFLVPEIKTILNESTCSEAATLAEECLSLPTPAEVRAVVNDYMSRRFPGHFLA